MSSTGGYHYDDDHDFATAMITLFTVFAIFIGFILAFGMASERRNEQRCKDKFGADYSFTADRPVTCVNSKGEAKYVK